MKEKICVLGLGYIGLPTASIFATNGYKVYGVDTNPDIVQTINNGDVHIEELGLRTIVKTAIQSANLRADIAPTNADVFIIAVPTPITKNKKPDLTAVFAATKSIIPCLEPGNLIILESTSPAGTTVQIKDFILKYRPELKKAKRKNRTQENLLIDIAYCPERVLPGRILKELIENDRIIGGINPKSSKHAAQLYESIVEGNVLQTDSTTAEMVKLIENTYRDVNIALANELAVICEQLGINAWEVISLANRHPRVNILNPGPGVGGHCIAVDPWFIVSGSRGDAKLIKTARLRNDSIPNRVVVKIAKLLKGLKNPKVALLGAAYKANIDDARESPAVDVLNIIKKFYKGHITVKMYDPFVKNNEIQLTSFEETIKKADLIVVLTDHDELKKIDPKYVAKLVKRKVIYDTRKCLSYDKWRQAGFKVFLIGADTIESFKIAI